MFSRKWLALGLIAVSGIALGAALIVSDQEDAESPDPKARDTTESATTTGLRAAAKNCARDFPLGRPKANTDAFFDCYERLVGVPLEACPDHAPVRGLLAFRGPPRLYTRMPTHGGRPCSFLE
jgi:hypothetical protein